MSGAAVDPAEERSVERFVFEEARLLDERRFTEWLDLFDQDGLYWVPGQPGAATPRDGLSLYCEHRALLAVRVARLGQASMHAQDPPCRTHHQVGAVTVRAVPTAERAAGEPPDAAADLEARSALIVCEWRDGEGRWFAGRVQHRLRRESGSYRILLKRVDLINCDAPHRALNVPF